MKISIGMLAHNEEASISKMIERVLKQDIFQENNYEVQFVIVANGCTDNTVSMAKQTFSNGIHFENLFSLVVELKQAGKSNAWNEFVHSLAWHDADYAILVDADIEFGSENVLKRLIESLENNIEATVAIDQVKKDVDKSQKKGILGLLSLNFSEGKKHNTHKAIAGSLYCARGGVIRRIYMPNGLPVEDGFFRAMVVTDNFTHLDDNSKIEVVDDVCHYFQAILSPLKLYRHEKRLIIGATINSMLFNYLWKSVGESGQDAGMIVNRLNAKEVNWLIDLVEKYKAKKGFWFVPSAFAFKYIKNILYGNKKLSKKLVQLPFALVATVIAIVITIDVNFFFRKNNGIGYW